MQRSAAEDKHKYINGCSAAFISRVKRYTSRQPPSLPPSYVVALSTLCLQCSLNRLLAVLKSVSLHTWWLQCMVIATTGCAQDDHDEDLLRCQIPRSGRARKEATARLTKVLAAIADIHGEAGAQLFNAAKTPGRVNESEVTFVQQTATTRQATASTATARTCPSRAWWSSSPS